MQKEGGCIIVGADNERRTRREGRRKGKQSTSTTRDPQLLSHVSAHDKHEMCRIIINDNAGIS